MDVSKNRGTPKSSILIGFSIINRPFWGTPIFGNTHIHVYTDINPFMVDLERFMRISGTEYIPTDPSSSRPGFQQGFACIFQIDYR